jgi:hypothetical protein
MTTILLDCDDVLLDWIEGFRAYASVRLQRFVEGQPDSWQMGSWLGTTDAVAFELIEEFNASPGFGQLGPVEGAVDVVTKWHQLLGPLSDVRLHVVTSCSSDPKTVSVRRANLERVFGKDVFDSVHCLDLGQSKVKVLQSWSPGTIWIEDNYKNALMGADVGHLTFIRKRPHNKEYQELHDARLTWFENWSELEEHI